MVRGLRRLKGTPDASSCVDALAAGHDVLLELDVHGALAVREQLPEAAPRLRAGAVAEEQRRPARAGAPRTPEAVERRLARAEAEERCAEQFDAVIVNDDVDRAMAELAAIVEARRSGAADRYRPKSAPSLEFPGPSRSFAWPIAARR